MSSQPSACPACKTQGRWDDDDAWMHDDLAAGLACAREGLTTEELAARDLLTERDQAVEAWASHRLACQECHVSGGRWCLDGLVLADLVDHLDLELAARRD